MTKSSIWCEWPHSSFLGIGNVQHVLTRYYMMSISQKLTVLQNSVHTLRLFSSPPGDFTFTKFRRNHLQMMVESLMKLSRHIDISIHWMKQLDESRLQALQALSIKVALCILVSKWKVMYDVG